MSVCVFDCRQQVVCSSLASWDVSPMRLTQTICLHRSGVIISSNKHVLQCSQWQLTKLYAVHTINKSDNDNFIKCDNDIIVCICHEAIFGSGILHVKHWLW